MTSIKSLGLSPELHAYLVAHGSPPDPVLDSLAHETQALGPISIMQVAPEQGALLTMLVRLCGARRVVEIGTFTGYSALCLARGLPDDGRQVDIVVVTSGGAETASYPWGSSRGACRSFCQRRRRPARRSSLTCRRRRPVSSSGCLLAARCRTPGSARTTAYRCKCRRR